jgi:hypothetical protein
MAQSKADAHIGCRESGAVEGLEGKTPIEDRSQLPRVEHERLIPLDRTDLDYWLIKDEQGDLF